MNAQEKIVLKVAENLIQSVRNYGGPKGLLGAHKVDIELSIRDLNGVLEKIEEVRRERQQKRFGID